MKIEIIHLDDARRFVPEDTRGSGVIRECVMKESVGSICVLLSLFLSVGASASVIVNVDASQHFVFQVLNVYEPNPGDVVYFEPIGPDQGGQFMAYQLNPGGPWYSYFHVQGGISPVNGLYGDTGGYSTAEDAFNATRQMWLDDLADGVIDIFRMTMQQDLIWTYPAGDKFIADNSGGYSFRLHINQLDLPPLSTPAPVGPGILAFAALALWRLARLRR